MPGFASFAMRLAAQLLGRGAASVCTLALPDGMGLDDWVAAQRSAGMDDDAIRLAFTALRSELPGRPLKATGKPRLYGGDRMQRSSLLQESLDVLASANTGADSLPILYRADIVDDGAGRVVQRDKADTVRYAPLSSGEYYYRLCASADWYVVDKDGNEQDHHPPRDLAELLTLAPPDARLPVLEGIYTHAVLIANEQGQPALLATPGYHEGAGVIIAGTEAPPFPPDADPVAALLEDLLLDFPFKTPADKANALAAGLTYIVKPFVGETPFMVWDKTEPGTGATKAAQSLYRAATGRDTGLTPYPKSEEEMGKLLTSHVMSGKESLLFDNVSGYVDSAQLAQLTSQHGKLWNGRLLSTNMLADRKVNTVAGMTSNKATLSPEMIRRAVRIRLDRPVPDPSEWTPDGKGGGWRYSLPDDTSRFRGVFEEMVRRWLDADAPFGRYPHSSASRWAQVASGILDANGVEGFLGNVEELRKSTGTRDTLLPAFIRHWWRTRKTRWVFAQDVRTWFTDESTEMPWSFKSLDGPGGTNAVSAKLQTLVGKVYDVDGARVIVTAIDEMPNDDAKRRRAWRLEPVDGMPDHADEPDGPP